MLRRFIMLKVFLLILLILSFTEGSLNDYKRCQIKHNCTQTLKLSDCPPGQFLDVNFSNECCHGCRTGIGRGESGCSTTRRGRKCSPGLTCDEDFYCILDRASCLHTMHLDEQIAWKPSCEIDGSFAAKQCRGDKLTGRCFCYAVTGEKIFGWEWWKDADNMTCKCSRQRYTAERSGRLDVTLHCLPNGNFEALQCDMGICWCADEQSGFIQPDTVAVPDNLWKFLSCYNVSHHGDRYLRKCESSSFAQRQIQKKMINRGAINAVPNQIACNYDGSFGDIIIGNLLAHCQMPDGSKLNYETPSRLMNEVGNEMNCNCARDEKIFKDKGIQFNMRCNINGNYERVQAQNGKSYCVDMYGFAVTPLLEPESGLDCDAFIYTQQEDIFNEEMDYY